MSAIRVMDMWFKRQEIKGIDERRWHVWRLGEYTVYGTI